MISITRIKWRKEFLHGNTPLGLTIHGNLLMKGDNIEYLPHNLTVIGVVDIRLTKVLNWPPNLKVTTLVVSNGVLVGEIPEDAVLGRWESW